MRILAKTQTLIVFDLEKDECNGMTVADLKLKLENYPGVELTANEQCLRYDGNFLSDEMLLNDVLGAKGDLFFLTKLDATVADACEFNEEEGAVGGVPVAGRTGSSDSKSILTDSDIRDVTLVPDLDFSTDEDGAAGVFDEDMELPPDLQQYYPSTVCVDEDLVSKLMVMGYEELDARVALQASFNDPERAVEYLIDGIPKSLRSTLPDIGDMTNSRTPPPSYTGSMCSDCSMVPTPPTPHSPDVSMSSLNINSNNCQNFESSSDIIKRSLFETDGYDGNDEADQQSSKLGKRKHKAVCKFKKRRIEIWAAKATIATASSNIAPARINTAEEDKKEADLLKQMSYASLNEIPAAVAIDAGELAGGGESCSTATEDGAANTVGGNHHENSKPKT